ncbi:hypothetical protein [Neogemmobacter tilapiae]|uniref:Uncharacterized protein n=1 Tax=Neogemmobacter tilapiae TaxID=875041 RepID=A0A918TWJ1_9RHOB|nr:hypothetical protein [Gemmobacter tilapiae]GHC66399.1 hypothetical protein GCM10007315_33900 [Gemmobacter tilapiae]
MTTFAHKTPPTPKRDFTNTAISPVQNHRDWRCKHCRKMLGVCRDGRMHLRFGGGHDYLVSLPVRTICPDCKTLNQKSAV